MMRLIKKRSEKTGLPPGTLVHIGERKTEKVIIRILDYDEAQFEEKEEQLATNPNPETLRCPAPIKVTTY